MQRTYMGMMSNVAATSVNDALIERIATFINSIGIPCRQANLVNDTFLPGIDIKNGELLYDKTLLKYPGDLLHDAGHIAVLKPEDRAAATSPDNINGDMQAGGAEMAAIAWSWAAAMHLHIAPEVLFHDDGYKGDARDMIEKFTTGKYIGLPILEWVKMTESLKKGAEATECTYPAMKCWLRP